MRADAATLLTAFGLFGLLSNLEAIEATLPDVLSFLATIMSFQEFSFLCCVPRQTKGIRV